eukprot:TRINITY_DN4897_c0_g1_i1.p1 TRINITY_DN4897_c0_g1~~TRINITY_DN4897_c0_g1_i1.p1  ORF type:complete len:589 (-),score=114.52 TRINITY_DN4897_c0_g1_i1:34-1800(-)
MDQRQKYYSKIWGQQQSQKHASGMLKTQMSSFVEGKMIDRYGFEEYVLHPDKSEISSSIFATKDWQTKEHVLITVQGGDSENFGIWNQGLCLGDGVQSGSMLPCFSKAARLDMGIICLNPYHNSTQQLNERFIPTDIPLLGAETPEKHCCEVWSKVLSKASKPKYYILAHGSGCALIQSLCENHADVLDRVACMSLVESHHRLKDDFSEQLKEFLKTHVVNYITSEQIPIDPLSPLTRSKQLTRLPHLEDQYGCRCLGMAPRKSKSGSSDSFAHARTIYAALDDIFQLFQTYMVDVIPRKHTLMMEDGGDVSDLESPVMSPISAETGAPSFSLTQSYGTSDNTNSKTETGSNSEQAPVEWVPDSSVKACQSCESPFTLTKRRHHCRMCGSCICKTCSPHRLFVSAIGRTERVCTKCFMEEVNKGQLSRDTLTFFDVVAIGETREVDRRLQSGQEVNACDRTFGYTALHVAAVHNDYKMVRLLLLHGADPNQQSNEGYVPLHFLCKKLNRTQPDRSPSEIRKCITLLMKQGASKDIEDFNGVTPWSYVARRSRIAWVIQEYDNSLGMVGFFVVFYHINLQRNSPKTRRT